MSEPTKPRPTCIRDLKSAELAQAELAAAQDWLQRFAGLLTSMRPAAERPLFVSQAGDASRLAIEQFDGGRDAQYFVVTGKVQQPLPDRLKVATASPPREMIGFLPRVAGTDIIYDLTDETLQGKARPFACDLKDVRARVYALLPVQIEAIPLTARGSGKDREVSVEFHDASGNRLQARLPFQLRIQMPDGQEHLAGYYVTEPDGRWVAPGKLVADLPAKCRLTVRSQLTGREETILL